MSENRTSLRSWDGEGKKICEEFVNSASQVILNKKQEFKFALTSFLAQGHFLIEDIPGVGKTTFVKTVGHLLGFKLNRIQFTSDLLPGDILGTPIYDNKLGTFKFYPGPVFSDFILADELNRATPRTQSALLQAMEERSVTVDRETYALSPLFFLVATQNPRFHLGTYSLPESQLDRFLMRIELGYPGSEAEISLLENSGTRKKSEELLPILNETQWTEIREKIKTIHISREVAGMIFKLLTLSRDSQNQLSGLSTRAGLALAECAKATAFLSGRDFVLPEDIQSIAVPVINHRILQGEQNMGEALSRARDLVTQLEIL
jgi:MoxR-like ATPase